MTSAWVYALIPAAAAIISAILAIKMHPTELVLSAVQRLAAAVVFAAAAGEILPGLLHQGSVSAMLLGGSVAVAVGRAEAAGRLGKRSVSISWSMG